jgi:cytochrome c oxidase subunit 2
MTKMKPVVHYSISFDSVMISTEDLANGGKRLLEVSNPVVLPVGVPIKTLVTSADVLHS